MSKTDILSDASARSTHSEVNMQGGGFFPVRLDSTDRKYINFTKLCCDWIAAGKIDIFESLVTNYSFQPDFDHHDQEGNNLLHLLFRIADECPIAVRTLHYLLKHVRIPEAAMNHRNIYGDTPITVGARRRCRDVHKMIAIMERRGAKRIPNNFGFQVMTEIDDEPQAYHHHRRHHSHAPLPEVIPVKIEIEQVPAREPEQIRVVQLEPPESSSKRVIEDLVNLFKGLQHSESSPLPDLSDTLADNVTLSATSYDSRGSRNSRGLQPHSVRISDREHMELHELEKRGGTATNQAANQGVVPIVFAGGAAKKKAPKSNKLASVTGYRQMVNYSDLAEFNNSLSDSEGSSASTRRRKHLSRETDGKKNDLHLAAVAKAEKLLGGQTLPKGITDKALAARAIKAIVYSELKAENETAKASGKSIKSALDIANEMVKRITADKIAEIIKKDLDKLKSIVGHLESKSSSSEKPRPSKKGKGEASAFGSSSSSTSSTSSSVSNKLASTSSSSSYDDSSSSESD